MGIIFILGGVISGLGKGVTSGSFGAILKEMGFTITIKKLDPYLNIDPGTMNPIEHGEVYVTEDGAETDLDLGYYTRLAEISVSKKNSISSGKLLYELLNKERKGDFLGQTVQFIPHFTDCIKTYILQDMENYDFTICEVGGSVGDYEAEFFLETVRQIKKEFGYNACICLVSYLVYYSVSNELKTKPTQVAIRQMMQTGIQPDMVFARTEHPIDSTIRKKLSLYTNVEESHIIQALNVPTIYQVPLEYEKEGLVSLIQKQFKIKPKQKASFKKWHHLNNTIRTTKHKICIGMIGKYVKLKESYYSVIEALQHSGWSHSCKINIKWINVRNSEKMIEQLTEVDGVVIPGGFGIIGIEEIILCIQYCREKNVPVLGICLGLQLSVIEFARNILKLSTASSREFGQYDSVFIVDLMKNWIADNGKIAARTTDSDMGGTLRLGNFKTVLKKGSQAHELYKKDVITERHRHRYEVDIKYQTQFEEKGMIFSGISPDGRLPEIVEIREHPYFIATQFHPEFNSTPFNPHPLFNGLIQASLTM